MSHDSKGSFVSVVWWNQLQQLLENEKELSPLSHAVELIHTDKKISKMHINHQAT